MLCARLFILFLFLAAGHGIMTARHYTGADSRPTKRRTISMANRVHAPQGSMFREHGIMTARHYTSADSRPTKRRTISMANRVHAPQE